MAPDVVVVGSLHLDVMVRAPRLPGLDETLMGWDWGRKCGGKGGNQAVAAARAGARTAFGGRIGADEFGRTLRDHLEAAGVDCACLETDATLGSGMSVAIEVEGGDYGAVVVSGANAAIPTEGLAARWATLWKAPVLLLQNEVPEAVDLAAARAAKGQGARVILNAAPARTMAGDLLGLVDVLVVNRVEAAMLAGDRPESLRTPSRDLVLTRGGEGLTLWPREGNRLDLPALPVEARSTHGAGDVFCGVLAARLAQGNALAAACAQARDAAGRFVAG
jgi:ribokinase